MMNPKPISVVSFAVLFFTTCCLEAESISLWLAIALILLSGTVLIWSMYRMNWMDPMGGEEEDMNCDDMTYYQEQLERKGITKRMLDMNNFSDLTAEELQRIVDSVHLEKKEYGTVIELDA